MITDKQKENIYHLPAEDFIDLRGFENNYQINR